MDFTISHGAEVRAQRVRDLYERSRLAILMLLLLILVIRWAMAAAYQVDGRVRTLFAMLVAVSLARWILAMIPSPRRDALAGVRTQYLVFATGSVLTSSTVGAACGSTPWDDTPSAYIEIIHNLKRACARGCVTLDCDRGSA